MSESRPSRPASFAGIALDRTLLMGIVNVTPDSFSDGGETLEATKAVARGLALMGDGADIIDVGGESTRPGASPVPVAEEIDRVLPVVRELASAGAVVSIDTRRADVMEACIDAGATIVNDVSGLTSDPRALSVVAGSGVHVILMHMQGDPSTMQVSPHYDDVAGDVLDWLTSRMATCEAAGIPRDRIAIDPGIGFGKTVDHNLAILSCLHLYHDLGCTVVIGLSRKSFIARLSGGEPPQRRVAGSLAGGLWAASKGAHVLRVHDVFETRQAIAVWSALADAAQHGVGRGNTIQNRR